MSNKSTSTQKSEEQLERSSKVLFRFDGRPDGIKDYLGHDVYRITDPKWLKFLESSKYELLDDDPTMIWEDSETHETWVLFDPERLQDGSHLNKTENQLVAHEVRIEYRSLTTGEVGDWELAYKGKSKELTRLEVGLKAFSKYLRLDKAVIEAKMVIEEESGYYGSYSYVHNNQPYYAKVRRMEGMVRQ